MLVKQQLAEAIETLRAERQFVLARQYPAEYVVLVGEEILFHGRDRSAALSAYEAALGRPDGRYPVLVVPEPPEYVRPVLRGRTLAAG